MFKLIINTASLIVGVRAVNMMQVNQYCVICPQTKLASIIDPGEERARDWMQWTSQFKAKIDTVMLTHGMPDRIVGLKDAQIEIKGLKTYAHRDDFSLIMDSERMSREVLGGASITQPNPPDVYLEDGDKVNVGKLSFEVIHTPGRSPGHVVYYEANEGLLFSGAVVLQNRFSPLTHSVCDKNAMNQSVKKLYDKFSEDVTVLPGNHGPTSLFQEREVNPFIQASLRQAKG